MIQDIAPLKLNNAYHRKKPKNNSRMLGFFDRMIYLKYDEKIEFLTYEQWTDTRREQKRRFRRVYICFQLERKIIFLQILQPIHKLRDLHFTRCFRCGPCSR